MTPGKLLLVAAQVPRNLYLAARNLRGVDVCDVEALDPVALVSHDTVLVAVDALRRIEENLQSDARRVRGSVAKADTSDDSEGNDEGASETAAHAETAEASAPAGESAPDAVPAAEATPETPPAEESAP